MQNNKISLKKSVYRVLRDHVILIVLLLGLFYGMSYLLFNLLTSYIFFDFSDIDLEDYRGIESDFLIAEDLRIEVLNSDLEVVYWSGVTYDDTKAYTFFELQHLLDNTSPQVNVLYERIEDESGNNQTVILKQYFTHKYMSRIKFFYKGMILVLVLGTCAIISYVFYRYIIKTYKTIKGDFDSFSRGIETGIIETSKINILEASEVAESYNTMVRNTTKAELEKEAAHARSRQLISSLAHDLKSPTTTLMGYADVLAEETDSMDKTKYLKYIGNSAKELNELVDALFQQMKYENGEYDLQPINKNLSNFIRDLCGEYDMLFHQRNFMTDYEISDVDFFLPIDELHLKRAFANILNNFIEHNPSDTRVRIVTEVEEDIFYLYFMNNGYPINEKDRANIFQPFYHVDTASRGKHSGLGLSISKQIIHMHGGEIQLLKSKDYTTIFKITFS